MATKKKLSQIAAAAKVLAATKRPMTCQEMVDAIHGQAALEVAGWQNAACDALCIDPARPEEGQGRPIHRHVRASFHCNGILFLKETYHVVVASAYRRFVLPLKFVSGNKMSDAGERGKYRNSVKAIMAFTSWIGHVRTRLTGILDIVMAAAFVR